MFTEDKRASIKHKLLKRCYRIEAQLELNKLLPVTPINITALSDALFSALCTSLQSVTAIMTAVSIKTYLV